MRRRALFGGGLVAIAFALYGNVAGMLSDGLDSPLEPGFFLLAIAGVGAVLWALRMT